MKTAKLRLTIEELGYILEALDDLRVKFSRNTEIEKTYNHIFNSLYKLEKEVRRNETSI